jgi:two-component system, OmpR family, phosphate regulon sensor histidine kinase PhoR
VERYNRIIMDEHARMRSQVDKILQMAALEEHETEFEQSRLDLHSIIERTAGQFALVVRSRGGVLKTDLNADHAMIEGDALHIENVIRNLLDNAVKYSPSAPEITIRTANEAHSIIVSIGDKGIGMAREYHARIFDKYFRIPTGNLHDVKGFGLGLSYVKLVVAAHSGTIAIESEPGRGTVVTVRFPCMGGQG